MSRYTTQVRWIVENSTPQFESFPMSQRIEEALPKIFNFNYPIWNEGYRRILEKKIIMHYFNKEICMETVALWKLYLEERLNLIMPYYNKMYETTVKDYDWLTSHNMVETYDNSKNNVINSSSQSTGTVSQNDNGTSTTKDNKSESGNETGETTGVETDKNKLLKSDLPQTNFAGHDYGTNLDESEGSKNNNVTSGKDYSNTSNSTGEVNTVNKSTGENTSSASIDSTGNTNENYTRTTKGYNVVPTDLLIKYRESLVNLDRMVIDDLYDLFMLIY